jgi:AraC-like DNA-binding protein
MSPKALTTEERKAIYRTKSFLLNHLHENPSVQVLARYAGMSEAKFTEAFHQLFSMTLRVYIHCSKMQLAYFLLLHTERPIKEIASITGYAHTQNFMHAFKQFFGCTAASVAAQRESDLD